MKLEHKELIEQARMMGIPAHEFAAGFITRDLVACCLASVRKYAKLHENQESALIDELNRAAANLVRAAVSVIAAKGVSAIGCTVKSVMVTGKNLRVVADVDASDPQRHALTDTVTQRALLVLAEDEYYDALDSNTAQKDQKELELQQTAGGEQSEQVVDAELTAYDIAKQHIVTGGEITAKAIQNVAGVKRKESGEILLKLAEEGIISEPDEDGKRTLLVAAESPVEPIPQVPASDDPAEAAFTEDEYADAVLLVQKEKRVSVQFLKEHLAVADEAAEAMILQMEQDGVVSEENDMGGRAVYD